MTLDERTKRNLYGVHADLVRVIERAYRESSVKFIVTEGLRSRERQAQLVAQGASRTMNSRHLTGHAVDVAAIDPQAGGVSWEWPLYERIAEAVKAAAESEGVSIVWGGDWTTFRDGPHFELERQAYPAPRDDRPPGSRGLRKVQRGLQEMGFDPGPTDGLWGPRTAAAVAALVKSKET